jgi:hypothetical protein
VLKHLDQPAWIAGILLVALLTFYFVVLGA